MRFKSDAQRKAAMANMFSKKNTTWLVFGDSIAMGYNDPKGGWVQKLKEGVYPDPVYNLGVDGDCINDISKRIVDESNRRIKRGENAKIIIAAGINDVAEKPSDVKKKLSGLLDAVKPVSDDITVVGITPVDDSKTNPVPWDDKMFYKNDKIKKLNANIEDICGEEGISYIGVHDKLSSKDLDDGLHPNASGHNKIFDVIKEAEGL